MMRAEEKETPLMGPGDTFLKQNLPLQQTLFEKK